MMKKYYQVTLTPEQTQIIYQKAINEIKYFKKVQITITAASKMLNHSTSGIPREVMGLLTGFYRQQKGNGIFTVTDIISLPVQASQTRVTADQQTYCLIAAYTQWLSKIKTHNIIGWYHSHPSYGCWLSGIDVNTQEIFQKNSQPFLAIVIDPIKSKNLQKVDLAAFRAHNKGYKQDLGFGHTQDIPRRKAVDFGVHYQRYYQIPVQIVTNSLGQQTLKNIQKLQWASQLSNQSFYEKQQKQYLIQSIKDQKLDIQEYIQVKQSVSSKYDQIRFKQKNMLKKINYYAKERNISLIDTAIKSLLF